MNTERLTLTDAAERLATTPEAVRQRIKRGSLTGVKEAGRWFVVLPVQLDATNQQLDAVPEPSGRQPDTQLDEGEQRLDAGVTEPEQATGRPSSRDQLVDELREEVVYLRAALEREQVASAELRRLLAVQLPALPYTVAPDAAGRAEEPEKAPAPTEPVQTAPQPARGFWARLFGR
jgi:hypothetical protein